MMSPCFSSRHDFKVGSEAPPFTVKDQDGTDVTLGSFKGEKNVIVYFYPKDATVRRGACPPDHASVANAIQLKHE